MSETTVATPAAVTKEDERMHMIHPFEWLTSPASLESLLVSQALLPLDKSPEMCKVLHVGSGSSSVGELMVRDLAFSLVVNVDKDAATLSKMKQRWHTLTTNSSYNAVSSSSNSAPKGNDNDATASSLQKKLQFLEYDFCNADKDDSNSNCWPFPSGMFDLVVDKSTLDCTLCSDDATAALLQLVHDSLCIGGVYLLISFHALDLLLPLLADLPGAEWHVTCTTMQRQVEQLLTTTTTTTRKGPPPQSASTRKEASTTSTAPTTTSSNPSSTTTPFLNVLIARKHGEGNSQLLTVERLAEHVHAVNDTWFRHHNPLVTTKRQEELQQAFLIAAAAAAADGNCNTNSTASSSLTLLQAYPVLFTDAEREHLTFENFLQDWQAFLEMDAAQGHAGQQLSLTEMTFETALLFLKEMQ
jgi:hypothetical protein